MKSHFFPALGLVLLFQLGVHGYVHINPPNERKYPLVQTQQGHGYNAKVSVYPGMSMALQPQPIPNPEQPQPSKSHPQQHVTFDSVVEKIAEGLLHRKLLPNELERKRSEEDAKYIKELQDDSMAEADRRHQAQRLIKFFRIQKMLEQEKKGIHPMLKNQMRRRKYGNGMRRLGRRRKQHGHQASSVLENKNEYQHQQPFGGHQTANHHHQHPSQTHQLPEPQLPPQNYAPQPHPQQPYQQPYNQPVQGQQTHQQTYNQAAHAQQGYQQQQAYNQPTYGQQGQQQVSNNEQAYPPYQPLVQNPPGPPQIIQGPQNQNSMIRTVKSMSKNNYNRRQSMSNSRSLTRKGNKG